MDHPESCAVETRPPSRHVLIKDFCSPPVRRLRDRFAYLYPDQAEQCSERLSMLIGRYGLGLEDVVSSTRWSEKDTVLITYGDMVRQPDRTPLQALLGFLDDRIPAGAIRDVHILPFFPYSSDDGFSVIDYRQVNPDLGSWEDIEAIAKRYRLAVDLVLNHCSRKSQWYREYVAGVAPARHYFVELNPKADLSAVVRPRALPLLTTTHTREGVRHLWTTFSPDQIDLNFANPDVLFEFLDILLLYLRRGARIFRLDAIAYLWKKIGTPCIHLRQTHEIVKLFRDVLEMIAPGAILLTETNVPHTENVSYFSHGDEAHMVYQFSLPPLLLHALLTGNGTHLTRWAASLGSPLPGTTYLNFTASHDGIGVRPLEGIVTDDERTALATEVQKRGGHVSYKTNADGGKSPYELNITYFDALSDPDTQRHASRFLCSQTIAMELQGIPAVYFHSLTATRNDTEGVQTKGYPRAINRRKWERNELNGLLDDPASLHAQVFQEYCRLLKLRTAQEAFHPDAAQQVNELGRRFFSVTRRSRDGNAVLTAVSNVTDQPAELQAGKLFSRGAQLPARLADLIGDKVYEITPETTLSLAPYQTLWLIPAT